MRILHVDLGKELRGGQFQVLLLLKTLNTAGYETMLLARGGSPLFEQAAELGLPVEPAFRWKLWRTSLRYDLVHVHDARAHTWTAIGSRRPFVVSRRVAFPVRTNLFSRWKYRRAVRFLAVSRFVAGKLEAAGVPRSKIDVVYDAVEVSAVEPSWHSDGPLVALATSDPQKGRDLIERASVLARLPVTFSNDLSKDLAHASALVYVSRSEGLGSAALLAMSGGVPLIASHIDGMAELFEPGVSGLAVENDSVSIAAAMRRLFEEPGLAERLVQNARKRVKQKFDTPEMLQRTVDSYRRAIAE